MYNQSVNFWKYTHVFLHLKSTLKYREKIVNLKFDALMLFITNYDDII